MSPADPWLGPPARSMAISMALGMATAQRKGLLDGDGPTDARTMEPVSPASPSSDPPEKGPPHIVVECKSYQTKDEDCNYSRCYIKPKRTIPTGIAPNLIQY